MIHHWKAGILKFLKSLTFSCFIQPVAEICVELITLSLHFFNSGTKKSTDPKRLFSDFILNNFLSQLLNSSSTLEINVVFPAPGHPIRWRCPDSNCLILSSSSLWLNTFILSTVERFFTEGEQLESSFCIGKNLLLHPSVVLNDFLKSFYI